MVDTIKDFKKGQDKIRLNHEEDQDQKQKESKCL